MPNPIVPNGYRPYPRHVHGPGGAYLEVQNDQERDAAIASGWSLRPVLDAPDPVPDKRKPGRPKRAAL